MCSQQLWTHHARRCRNPNGLSAQRHLLLQRRLRKAGAPVQGPQRPVVWVDRRGHRLREAPRPCSGHRDVTGAARAQAGFQDPRHLSRIPGCPGLLTWHQVGDTPAFPASPQTTNPPCTKTSWSRLQQELSGTSYTSTSISNRYPKTKVSNTSSALRLAKPGTPHSHRMPRDHSLQPAPPPPSPPPTSAASAQAPFFPLHRLCLQVPLPPREPETRFWAEPGAILAPSGSRQPLPLAPGLLSEALSLASTTPDLAAGAHTCRPRPLREAPMSPLHRSSHLPLSALCGRLPRPHSTGAHACRLALCRRLPRPHPTSHGLLIPEHACSWQALAPALGRPHGP